MKFKAGRGSWSSVIYLNIIKLLKVDKMVSVVSFSSFLKFSSPKTWGYNLIPVVWPEPILVGLVQPPPSS